MLIRFSVENFLSFRDRQTFSMIAGRGGKDKSFHIVEKKNSNDVSLLKTGVVFGANASGKSNLVRAIDFGRNLIVNGTQPGKAISFQKFRLNKESLASPSRIEFEIKHNDICYAYGFVFTSKKIVEEWLYKINKKNERVVFERSNTSEFDLNSLLKQNPKKEEQQFLQFIAKGTPDNQLFLTEVINRRVRENVSDIQELLDVIDWFQNILTVWHPDTKPSWMQFLMESDKKVAASFEEFLKYFDTGIDGIIFKEMDFDKIFIPEEIKQDIQNGAKDAEVGSATWVENQALNIQYLFVKEEDGSILVFKLMTVHNVEGADIAVDHFDIGDESDGTQRIVDFIPMISLLFHSNKVFVVDELERSLHPNLVYEVLNMFLNKSQTSSQLIIAGHESSLLTQKLLRKDEIWFTIKDEKGATSLSSLEEYAIRYDKQIRKDYLNGRYKAVPRFGNRNSLSILNAE